MKQGISKISRAIMASLENESNFENVDLHPEPTSRLPPPVPSSTSENLAPVSSSDYWAEPREYSGSNKDEFETQLEANTGLHHSYQYLLDDYRFLKDQPAGEIFRNLVWVETIQPYSPQPIESRLVVQDEKTFSECLDELRIALEPREETPYLQTCLVSSILVNETIDNLLYSKLVSLIYSSIRVTQLWETPNRSILFAISQAWKPPPEIIDICLNTSKAVRSFVFSQNLFYRKKSSLQVFSMNHPEWLSLQLKWQSKAPRYKSNFNTYLWQPHIRAPKVEGAWVFISKESEENWKVLISWKLENSQAKINTTPQRYLTNLRKELLQWPDTSSHGEAATIASVFSIYTILITETQTFHDTLLGQITSLTIEGRRSPRINKINFLLHLDDCRQASIIDLYDAINLLKEISDGFSLSTHRIGNQQFRCRMAQLSVEFEHLRTSLEAAGEAIEKAKVMIKEQIDYRQIGFTSMMAVLAAIYLPFSFVSGLFGMNISDPLWNSPANTSNSTNATASLLISALARVGNISLRLPVNDTPASNTSEASQSLSAADAAGPHLWTFKLFIALSITGTAITIILPLVANRLFRTTLRLVKRYREFSISTSLVIGIPLLLVFENKLPRLVFPIILGIPLGAIAMVQWGLAVYTQRHRKRWYLFLTILIFCFANAVQTDGTRFLLWLPLVVCLILLLAPSLFTIKRLLIWKDNVNHSKRIRRQRDNYRKHAVRFQRLIFLLWILLNAAISNILSTLWSSSFIYLLTVFIIFALYSLERWYIRDELSSSASLGESLA